MKTSYASALLLALSAVLAGNALADEATPKTREQVRAELLQYQAEHRNDAFLPYTHTNAKEFMNSFKLPAATPDTVGKPAVKNAADQG